MFIGANALWLILLDETDVIPWFVEITLDERLTAPNLDAQGQPRLDELVRRLDQVEVANRNSAGLAADLSFNMSREAFLGAFCAGCGAAVKPGRCDCGMTHTNAFPSALKQLPPLAVKALRRAGHRFVSSPAL